MQTAEQRRFALVAGEASGDLLAGLLLDGLQARWPNLQTAGIGGPRMLAHGFQSWWPQEKLAVRGYIEVLRHYAEIAGIRRQLKARLLLERPELFIGVDAPDFNLDLEAGLRSQGIKTVHFICPSIWAWRPKRIEKVRAAADHVLCIFPFEPELLARHGIATLRYDKRGIGASTSAGLREADLRLDDYVDDATAWLRQLRADPRFAKVMMAGHSEGALIAMLACRQAQVDGCVLIAGVGSALDDVLRAQLKPRLAPDLYAQNERILLALKRGEQVGDVPPALLSLYRPAVQLYLISSLKADPRVAVAALRMPVLILQGTTDVQVSVADAQALSAAAPSARLVIVPGMNHVLKLVGGDLARQLPSYGDPSLPLAPALVEALTGFVQAP